MQRIISFLLIGLLISSSTILQAQIPSDNLLVYYPFNGNALDESLNNYHASVDGAILSTDRAGNRNSAYFFSNGSSIKVFIDQLPVSNEPRSISLWIKLNCKADSDVPICWGRPYKGNAYGIALGIVLAKPRGFRHFGYGDDMVSAFEYPQTEWFHIATTYDGNTGILYVNGQEVGRGIKPNWNTALDSLFIGKNVNGNPNDYFEGFIDDIRIYKDALTSFEVQALYNEDIVINKNSVNQLNTNILHFVIASSKHHESVVVKMDCNQDAGPYILEIRNMFSKEIYRSKIVSETTVPIGLFNSSGTYVFTIRSTSNKTAMSREILID